MPAPTPCLVTSVAGAGAFVAAGANVVVVVDEGHMLGARPPGAGRIAVLVGDWEDADIRVAAAAMGAEVFGA